MKHDAIKVWQAFHVRLPDCNTMIDEYKAFQDRGALQLALRICGVLLVMPSGGCGKLIEVLSLKRRAVCLGYI